MADETNMIKIAQINVMRRRLTHREIQWAVDQGVDLLAITEFAGVREKLTREVISAESAEADVAMILVNKTLAITIPYAKPNHLVIRISDIKINLHLWYIQPQSSLVSRKGSEEALLELEDAIGRAAKKCLHIGDINAQSTRAGGARDSKRGTRLNRSYDRGNLVNLNKEGQVTWRNSRCEGANDWALASPDVADWTAWSAVPDYFGSDHETIFLTMHKPRRETRKAAEMVIKPAIFLREVKKIVSATEEKHWLRCKDEAAKRALRPRKEKRWQDSEEVASKKKQITDLVSKISRAKGELDHRRAELRGLAKECRELVKKQGYAAHKAELRKLRGSEIYKKLVLPKKGRKATHVAEGDTQLRGREASERILSKVCNGECEPLTINSEKLGPARGDFTATELECAIENFASTAAPGMDGISWGLLKQWWQRMPEYFIRMFNTWKRERTFPDELKEAAVVPLLKKPSGKSTIDNLRPISLLTTISKWFEKLLDITIMHHMEKEKRLSPNQYAYREGKSGEGMLMAIAEELRRPEPAKVVVKLDVKAAFDRLKHQAIIDRLTAEQLPGDIVEVIVSYLTNRRATATMHGESVTGKIGMGAPQGSALGPHLFIITTDEALKKATRKASSLEGANSRVFAFADDVVITVAAENYGRAVVTAEKIAETMAKWLKKAGLELATEKTSIMLISQAKVEPEVTMMGVRVKAAGTMTILGVDFEHDLQVEKFVAKTAGRGLAALDQVAQAVNMLGDRDIKRELVRAKVLQKISYGAGAWATAMSGTEQAALNRVSAAAAKRIASADKRAGSAAAHILANITPYGLECEKRARIANVLRAGVTSEGEKIVKKVVLGDRPEPKEWKRRTLAGEISEQQQADAVKGTAYYTDGSRYQDSANNSITRVGCAYVKVDERGNEIKRLELKLPSHSTVFQAEMMALTAAIADSQRASAGETVAFLVDSMSVLEALCNPRPQHDQLISCQKVLDILERRGVQCDLYKVKAHAGIKFNEEADEAAKRAAVTGAEVALPVPESVVKRGCEQQMKAAYDGWYVKQSRREIGNYVNIPSDGEKNKMIVNAKTSAIYAGCGWNKTSVKYGHRSDDKCSCGARQSAKHIVADCQLFMAGNLQAAAKVGIGKEEFFADWDQLKKHRCFHKYIAERATTVHKEIAEINKEAIAAEMARRDELKCKETPAREPNEKK